MNDRDRLSPITLTGEYPVTQFEVDCCFSKSALFDNMRSFFFQHCRFHSIPLTWVDHCSRSFCISFCHVFNFFSVFGNYLNDRNIEFLCELKITVIVSRNTHDRSCTIIRQYIIRQPNRSLFSAKRIDRIASRKYACLLFILKTIYVWFHWRIVNIFFHCFSCLICRKRCRHLMFRSKHHKCRTVKCVRSCRIYSNFLISSVNREIHLCSVRFSDPVSLHFLYFFRPVQLIEII